MEVELDLRKPVVENAADYYEKSKKAKGKIEGAEKSITETRKKIELLESKRTIETDTATAGAPSKKVKRKWFESFRWFVSSDGFLVVGGRDATSNEVLIKKHVEPKDLVFHANVQGAPFFAVKNPEKETVPDKTLSEAAEAAASYSSGWKNGLGSCDVYMVDPAQLSKTPESGEYLAKGAFVVRGERRWFKNTPLKIAVGFDSKNNEIVGGPVSAVAVKTSHYIVLAPGNSKLGEIAAEIKKSISRKTGKEEGAMLKKISIDEIHRVLPSGGGNILT